MLIKVILEEGRRHFTNESPHMTNASRFTILAVGI